MRRIACLALVLTGLLASGRADAAQLVTFSDGRMLPVEGVRHAGATAVLSLEGGGELAVPAARITRLEPMRERKPAATAPGSVVAATPAVAPRRTSEGAWRQLAGPYAEVIGRAASRHKVDPALLTAVAHVESAFDPYAVSPKGAAGLLQLMPDTAQRFGAKDVFDVEQNVQAGAQYLGWLMKRFAGNVELALAGYNAGEGAVDRHNGVPPYSETRSYVARVLEGASRLGASLR